MYISEITIKNYRNFGDNLFKMRLKPFTAIIGANNIGKTNLLDCIGLILSQDITMFKKRMLQLDDINYQSRNDFKKQVIDSSIEANNVVFPEVEVGLVMDDLSDKQQSVVGDWFVDDSLNKAKLTYLFRPRNGFDKIEFIEKQRTLLMEYSDKNKSEVTSQKLMGLIEFPIRQYEYFIYGGNETSNKCDGYFLRMIKLEILDALRDVKRELSANGEFKLLYKVLHQDENAAYTDIKDILSGLDEKLRTNKNLKAIQSKISELLEKISLDDNEGYNNIDFHFSSPEISDVIKKLSLIYGNDPISIERNGLGRNNLLFISLILSHLSENNKNGQVVFRVVGIEEPEAHLHPHLQKHLSKNIEEIKTKDMQVLLTSHSSHLTTSIDLDNVAVLYHEQGEVKYHYLTEGFENTSEGKRHKRYIKKFLDATNSTMFFARKIILVEGISEQILIPSFFKSITGKTLERYGCNLVNVNGVAFKHFLEIIKNGYFIKCAVLTDSDVGKRTENRAKDLKQEYASVEMIQVEISNDTFEKEIISANKSGEGKEVLLEAIKMTRPQKGKQLEEKFQDVDLNMEECFELIEKEKSDFAFNLHELLQKRGNKITVPDYIKKTFSFIRK